MDAAGILKEVADNFENGARRKFLPGLLISFAWLLQDLKATGGKFANLDEFYVAHPRVTKTRAGNDANTLIVKKDANKTLSIRPFYDKIQHWIRADQRRFDYPSAAPHATQAWKDYQHWLESLLAMTDEELDALVEAAKKFVLDKLPAQDIAVEALRREPPRFYLFLRDFDLSKHKGEMSGAAYQGTVFGYIRADSSHLQVDVDKVRTGSKRVGRVGDVDAREGDVLVLSAEVKQFVFDDSHLGDVAEFASLVARHRALGLIVALDFANGVREKLLDMGLEPVAKKDLLERVRLWDPLKQRIAVQALIYYTQYKEQNSALLNRIRAFFIDIEEQAEAESFEAVSVSTELLSEIDV
jgi:Fe2+ transport system protein FeoA